jgi:hypothetical protein
MGLADRMARLVIPAIALATAATTLAVGSIAGHTPETLASSALAAAAALVIILLIRPAPVLAFGLLFLVASLSRFVIDLPVGRVRLEQPAILGSFVALAVLGRLRALRDRSVIAVGACFGLYLSIMMLSSVLNAPALAVSLRLLIWTAISMLSAVVAYALLVGRPGEEHRSLSWVGALQGIAGFAVAVLFLVAGPLGIPGMQVNPGEVPKVASVDFEANLFASLLAMLAPFALEEWRRRRTAWSAAVLVITIAALGLGVTRGAYLGLAGGLVVYIGLLAVHRVPRTILGPLVGLTAVALVLAPAASSVLLPVQRPPAPISLPAPGATVPAGSTTPQPTPIADTLAYRLDRVPTALADIKTSPIIGLGAAAYGQRHPRLDAPGAPDYIGTLALVAVYETGGIGALALAAGLLLLLALLVRIGSSAVGNTGDVGRAAAYAGAITSFLLSYQATNALWFSINWLIMGAALAFVVSCRLHPVSRDALPSGR